MTDYLNVSTLEVPRLLALEAYAHLQRLGEEGLEGFALWAGRLVGDRFSVEQTIIPDQTSLRSDGGVCVVVEGDELHRLNVRLYEENLRLVAQLHAHPTEAYHSDTDDRYPIVATLGGLSVVVPDFAQSSFSVADWAVFRLFPRRGWVRLSPKEVDALLAIV